MLRSWKRDACARRVPLPILPLLVPGRFPIPAWVRIKRDRQGRPQEEIHVSDLGADLCAGVLGKPEDGTDDLPIG